MILSLSKNGFLQGVLLLVLVLIDQISKYYVLTKIGLGNNLVICKDFLRIYVVQNTGGAFSLFDQFPVFFKVFGIFNVLIFLYLVFNQSLKLNNFVRVGCTFILSGTFGNLIDRFYRNGVVDFIDLMFVNFAVFNIADIFIDMGVVLIIIGWFVQRDK